MATVAEQARDPAPAAEFASSNIFDTPAINPVTGLSTDYLNHFTEAVMALELVTVVPDCLHDLEAWKPKSYCEHFAASRFTNRHRVIAAYLAAPESVRDELNAISETLNAVLQQTRDAVVTQLASPVAAELSQRAAAWLKPLIARAAAVINGTTSDSGSDRSCTQATIDTLFSR